MQRQIARIWGRRARLVGIRWPVAVRWAWPEEEMAVYGGDAVFGFACSDEPPFGAAVATIQVEGGEEIVQRCPLPEWTPRAPDDWTGEELLRIAAALRMRTLAPDEAEKLALRYAIPSAHASYVLTLARAEEDKAHGIPVLRKVPQMLAAGWGGVGSVRAKMPDMISYRARLRRQVSHLPRYACKRIAPATEMEQKKKQPAAQKRKPARRKAATKRAGDLQQLARWLEGLADDARLSWQELVAHGLPKAWLEELIRWGLDEWPEETATRALVCYLVQEGLLHVQPATKARIARWTADEEVQACLQRLAHIAQVEGWMARA